MAMAALGHQRRKIFEFTGGIRIRPSVACRLEEYDFGYNALPPP